MWPGEHERLAMSEPVQHLGDHRRHRCVGHADSLVAYPGGIRERTEEVEYRAKAELAPNRRDVAHRRVVRRCVKESDAGGFDAGRHARRRQ